MQPHHDVEKSRFEKSPVRCIQLSHSRNIYCMLNLASPQGLVMLFLKSAGFFLSFQVEEGSELQICATRLAARFEALCTFAVEPGS